MALRVRRSSVPACMAAYLVSIENNRFIYCYCFKRTIVKCNRLLLTWKNATPALQSPDLQSRSPSNASSRHIDDPSLVWNVKNSFKHIYDQFKTLHDDLFHNKNQGNQLRLKHGLTQAISVALIFHWTSAIDDFQWILMHCSIDNFKKSSYYWKYSC